MKQLWRHIVGVLCIPLVRLWLLTLRVQVIIAPELRAHMGEVRPWVLCFFHGTQFGLLRWPRRRNTGVLVSHSADGSLQARFLRSLGFRIVRGSSSNGGTSGLRGLVRLARGGADLAFAVDGPRGPREEVKGGAIACAALGNGRLVGIGVASSAKFVLQRAWDKFEVPYPFARVCIVLTAVPDGTPMSVKSSIVQANSAAVGGLLDPHGRDLRPLPSLE